MVFHKCCGINTQWAQIYLLGMACPVSRKVLREEIRNTLDGNRNIIPPIGNFGAEFDRAANGGLGSTRTRDQRPDARGKWKQFGLIGFKLNVSGRDHPVADCDYCLLPFISPRANTRDTNGHIRPIKDVSEAYHAGVVKQLKARLLGQLRLGLNRQRAARAFLAPKRYLLTSDHGFSGVPRKPLAASPRTRLRADKRTCG